MFWLDLACFGLFWLGLAWFWLALACFGWLWLAPAASGFGWIWLAPGWLWFALVGSGWLSKTIGENNPRSMNSYHFLCNPDQPVLNALAGWLSLPLDGSGWLWLGLAGSDWLWLALAGSGWKESLKPLRA